MPDTKDNLNLIHLSRLELKDEQIPKIEQIIQIGKDLLNIFDLFNMNKFYSYYSRDHKDK